VIALTEQQRTPHLEQLREVVTRALDLIAGVRRSIAATPRVHRGAARDAYGRKAGAEWAPSGAGAVERMGSDVVAEVRYSASDRAIQKESRTDAT
jgi:hypothetical protein